MADVLLRDHLGRQSPDDVYSQRDFRENVWTTVGEIQHVFKNSGVVEESWATKAHLCRHDDSEGKGFATITTRMHDAGKRSPANFSLFQKHLEMSVAVNLSAAALNMAVLLDRFRPSRILSFQYSARLTWEHDGDGFVTGIVVTFIELYRRSFATEFGKKVIIKNLPDFNMKPTDDVRTLATKVEEELKLMGGTDRLQSVRVDLSGLSGFNWELEDKRVSGDPRVGDSLLPVLQYLYTTVLQSYANVYGSYELKCEFPNVYPRLVLSYDVAQEMASEADPQLRFAKQRQMLSKYIVDSAQIYQPYKWVGHVLDDYVLISKPSTGQLDALYRVFQDADRESTDRATCIRNMDKLLKVTKDIEAFSTLLKSKNESKLDRKYNIVAPECLTSFKNVVQVSYDKVTRRPTVACTPLLDIVAGAMLQFKHDMKEADELRNKIETAVASPEEGAMDGAAPAKVPLSAAFYRELEEGREHARELGEQLYAAKTGNEAAIRGLQAAALDVETFRKQAQDSRSQFTQAGKESQLARTQAKDAQTLVTRLQKDLLHAKKQLEDATVQLTKIAATAKVDGNCKTNLARVREDVKALTKQAQRTSVDTMRLNAMQQFVHSEAASCDAKVHSAQARSMDMDSALQMERSTAKRKEANLERINADLRNKLERFETSAGFAAKFKSYLATFLEMSRKIQHQLKVPSLSQARTLTNFKDAEGLIGQAWGVIARLANRSGDIGGMPDDIVELERQRNATLKEYSNWQMSIPGRADDARDPDQLYRQIELEYRKHFNISESAGLDKQEEHMLKNIQSHRRQELASGAALCAAEIEQIKELQRKLRTMEEQYGSASAELEEVKDASMPIPELSYDMNRRDLQLFLGAQRPKISGIPNVFKTHLLPRANDRSELLLNIIHDTALELGKDMCPRLNYRKDLVGSLSLNEALCLVAKLAGKNTLARDFVNGDLAEDNHFKDAEKLVEAFTAKINTFVKSRFGVSAFRNRMIRESVFGTRASETIMTEDKTISFYYDLHETEPDFFSTKAQDKRKREQAENTFLMKFPNYYQSNLPFASYKQAFDDIESEYTAGITALRQRLQAEEAVFKPKPGEKRPTLKSSWFVDGKQSLVNNRAQKLTELKLQGGGDFTASGPQIFCAANPGYRVFCTDTRSGDPVEEKSGSMATFTTRLTAKPSRSSAAASATAVAKPPGMTFVEELQAKSAKKRANFTLELKDQTLPAKDTVEQLQAQYENLASKAGLTAFPFPYQAYLLPETSKFIGMLDVSRQIRNEGLLLKQFLEDMVDEIQRMRGSAIFMRVEEYADPDIVNLLTKNLVQVFESDGNLLVQKILEMRRTFIANLRVSGLPFLTSYSLLSKDVLASVDRIAAIAVVVNAGTPPESGTKLAREIVTLRTECVKALIVAMNEQRKKVSKSPIARGRESKLAGYPQLQDTFFTEGGAVQAVGDAGEHYDVLANQAIASDQTAIPTVRATMSGTTTTRDNLFTQLTQLQSLKPSAGGRSRRGVSKNTRRPLPRHYSKSPTPKASRAAGWPMGESYAESEFMAPRLRKSAFMTPRLREF